MEISTIGLDLAKSVFQDHAVDAEGRQDAFDYIERFYNLTRRHWTLGYLSPMGVERQANVA
jgi:transposase InsO family protein